MLLHVYIYIKTYMYSLGDTTYLLVGIFYDGNV